MVFGEALSFRMGSFWTPRQSRPWEFEELVASERRFGDKMTSLLRNFRRTRGCCGLGMIYHMNHMDMYTTKASKLRCPKTFLMLTQVTFGCVESPQPCLWQVQKEPTVARCNRHTRNKKCQYVAQSVGTINISNREKLPSQRPEVIHSSCISIHLQTHPANRHRHGTLCGSMDMHPAIAVL